MGDRNDPWTFPLQFDPLGEKALRHAEEDGVAKARNQIEREGRMAESEALRYLAEVECPNDLIEWGRNHKIENFAELTWINGFMAGWRAMTERRERLLRKSK